jgi:ABC-type spermidine/putrescine transport system permease subunit I
VRLGNEPLSRADEGTLTRSLPLTDNFRKWRQRHGSTVLLAAPLLIYMGVVFVVPILLQIAFAFYTRELYKGVIWRPVPKFTLENFGRAFSGSEPYLQSIVWTVGIAFFTSTVSICLSLPVAYFLARFNPRGKSLIELSFLLPIFGDIFTLFALAFAFTPQGPVNWLLMGLHLIQQPIQFINGSPLGVILWMSVPTLSVLLIRSSLAGVDVIYEEAAQTMGANVIQTFLKVTLPLAKRGIMGALLLSVSAGVGIYTAPLILVGPYNSWLSNKIYREITPFSNYPMASALGVILTLVSFSFLYLYLRTQEVGEKS